MSLSTNMGAMIQDISASCITNYIKPNAIDLVHGIDPENKNKLRPVDPVMVKLMAVKDSVSKGGDSLSWTGNEAMPTTKTVNAYKGYTYTRAPGLITFRKEWSLLTTPILIYGMDLVLNQGKQAILDLYERRVLDGFRSHMSGIMRRYYGDGVTAWNPLLATPAQEALEIEEDGVPAEGLGFGNSTVTNAILSNKNTIYGKNRLTSTRLQAKCYDVTSATDMAGPGVVTAGLISNVQLTHIRHGIAGARKMGIDVDLALCGRAFFDRVQAIANAKGIVTEDSADKDLLKFGFKSFIVDGVAIAPSDYMDPTQVNFVDTKNTRFMFCAGEEPQLSEPVKDPNKGWRVFTQEISSLMQIVSYDPSRNSCLYNLVVG